MKKLCFAAIIVAMSATAVSAADKNDGDEKEKKICRTEKVTGSRTRVNRICMTEAEWDELRRATKQQVDRFQGRAGTTYNGGQNVPGGS